MVPVLLAIALLCSSCFYQFDTFGFGADGTGPGPVTVASQFTEPNCNPVGNYDLYMAEVGHFTSGSNVANSPVAGGYDNRTLINDAWIERNQKDHGLGTGSFVFMAGPAYEGSRSPTAWGQYQASSALADYNAAHSSDGHLGTFGFLFGDIEITATTTKSQQGGLTGDQYESDGWYFQGNGSAQLGPYLTANLQVWTAFYSTLEHDGINVGVYSSPLLWHEIMNQATVPTVQWTSEGDAGPETPCPVHYSNGPSGISANFFGNYTNRSTTLNSLIWQWAQSADSPGDEDQVDITHWEDLFGLSNFNS
jgi:hypothetical protein